MDDEDFTLWRRVIIIALVTVVIGGVLSIAYFWYEARFITVAAPMDAVPSEPPLTSVQKQQNLLKSFTAPDSAATTSNTAATKSKQAPASFNAPAQSAKAAAQTQPTQAELNSFTAPTQ